MKYVFPLVALLSFGALAEEAKAPPKLSSGPGWSVAENPSLFPEVQLYGGVGAGLPGIVWGTVGFETHQIFPLLYTDFTLRASPAFSFGDLEGVPYTQNLGVWGRARVGLTWESKPRSHLSFVTGYEKVGEERVSKIFEIDLDHARAYQFYASGELRPIDANLGGIVGLGFGWETQTNANVKWDIGAGARDRDVVRRAAYYIEPRVLLGDDLGYGLLFQTTHTVDWLFLPGFVNFELGGYYTRGFDFSTVDADAFAFDAMVELGFRFDLDFGKGPLFFKPLTAEEKARRAKAKAERKAREAEEAKARAEKKAEKAAKKEMDAKKKADDAAKAADDAKKDADDAKKDVDDAKKDVDDAKKDVDEAKKAVDDAATTTGSDAADAADNAMKKADDAKSAADDAKKDVDDAAEKTRDDAKKTRDDAKKDVDDAAKKASDAAKIVGVGPSLASLVNLRAVGDKQTFVETKPGAEPGTLERVVMTRSGGVLTLSTGEPVQVMTNSVMFGSLNVLRGPIEVGARWTSGDAQLRVRSTSAVVSVPAGTFKDVVEVVVTRDGREEVWSFASGVGLVRLIERTSGSETRRLERKAP